MMGILSAVTDLIRLILEAVGFLIGGAFLLRFWMQVVRVRPPMRVAQVVFALTDWLLRPMRRIVPGVAGYDWASFVGVWLIACLVIVARAVLSGQPTLLVTQGGWVAISVLILFFKWVLSALQLTILMEVLFSWINPMAPASGFVRALNAPVLNLFRRFLPSLGGLDLSPMFALLIIYFVQSRVGGGLNVF